MDKLVENKWLYYQTILSLSLMNEYDKDLNDLLIARTESDDYIKHFKEFHTKYRFHDKLFNCNQYHCMKSAYQYHKLSDTSRSCNNDHKHIKLKYDHFKNRTLSKKSLIKEHLWYNLKNKDAIVISGIMTWLKMTLLYITQINQMD